MVCFFRQPGGRRFRECLTLKMAAAAVPALCSIASAQAPAAPVTGKSLRYCNPLPIPTAQGAAASGDVTVIREKDKYYMFCTGGGAWVSSDLVNWEFHAVQGRVPVAPDVVKYNGAFYMCGNNDNGGDLFRAPDPLGPYEDLGPFKNTGDASTGWANAFDMKIYVDDDNKPYLYFPGRAEKGIYVVPLKPDDLTTFAQKPTHLFSFNPDHVWERYGEMNEYPDVSWVEGPWIFKHDGTYYLQYSASGTQWKTYATGMYNGKSPMGPFTYQANNPLLRKTDGIVTGPGHGCAVQAPDGTWWQFYTIVLGNPPGGRRIGMDPYGFDKDGNAFVHGPTETPQWAPGVVADPAKNNDSGSIPITINKLRAMNAQSSFSSQKPGHDAAYAIDNSNGTWWEPADDDAQPTLTIDLSPATRFDPVQTFTIDSARILFNGGGGFGGRGGAGRGRGGGGGFGPNGPGGGAAQAPATAPAGPPVNAYQYKIEASTDGTTFSTVLDQTKNTVSRNTIFEEIPPTTARFVRFTITNWPRNAGPLGVIEFTVFGKPIRVSR